MRRELLELKEGMVLKYFEKWLPPFFCDLKEINLFFSYLEFYIVKNYAYRVQEQK